VPQDDIVYAELTVKENLLFAGKFRLPAGTSKADIEDLADETLANLGLTRVADNVVGDVNRRGVSGGEKKRVNIGLELMANPSILFLDEPTSGLDSSSAMVVMNGLKHLVRRKGMTICSVIHQPRKTIFELFDSLVLLGVGGRMVYHGPVSSAKSYFEGLDYTIPEGESIADWLIDISSGRTSPSKELTKAMKTIDKGSANAEENEAEKAKLNRAKLYRLWNEHMDNLTDESRQTYMAPKKSDLPKVRVKQSFTGQLITHIRRNFIVTKRNRISKAQDTVLLGLGALLICVIDGVVILTKDSNPAMKNEYEILTTNDPAVLAKNANSIAASLFSFTAHNGSLSDYGNKVSIIICVLLGIAAAKVLTEKRLEMFREAGSGYNLNAYYLSVNITSTLEHTCQILFIGLTASWMRHSASSFGCAVLNYVMLGWVVTSWSLLFPLFVPAKSVVLVISFFNLFFGILFSGTTSPGKFKDIYDDSVIEFIAGFFSPARYFIETMMLSEFRVLPPQTGVTLYAGLAPNLPINVLTDVFNVGRDDVNDATKQTLDGWYHAMLAPLFVGFTTRLLGAILIHTCNRSAQAKSSFFTQLMNSPSFCVQIFILVVLFLIFFIVTIYLIL